MGKTLVSVQVVGSRFNNPIYDGIFINICSLFPSPNFPIVIVPTKVAWIYKSIPCRFPIPSPGLRLEKGAYLGQQSTLCQSFPTRLIYIICKFSRSFLHLI
jgi:hypothetical protein